MCTLHLFYHVFPETPVLFAANRDEILDRAWQGPAFLASEPRIYGPRDGTAGGTWLGLNEAGVLVSLANHYGTLTRAPSLCSRGTVVLEALRRGSAGEAAELAERAAPACKSYTLLVVDPQRAYVIDRAPGGVACHRLRPGCHVITNMRFRDPADPKARRSLERMAQFAVNGTAPSPEEVFRFLGAHEPAAVDASPLCIHAKPPSRFGTSSSSLVAIGSRGVQTFLFAPGPPCSTPFSDVTPDFGAA